MSKIYKGTHDFTGASLLGAGGADTLLFTGNTGTLNVINSSKRIPVGSSQFISSDFFPRPTTPMPRAGILSNFSMRAGGNFASGSMIYKIYLNGIATNLSVTITGFSTALFTSSQTIAVNKGDLVHIETSGGSANQVSITHLIELN